MTLMEKTLAAIAPVDRAAMALAQERWNAVGKPLGALGAFEDIITRMAGVFRDAEFSIAEKTVVVMCADNGVVAEGISQSGQEVTAIVAANMAAGSSSVCRMARIAGATVLPVNIGIAQPMDQPGLLQCCVAQGTANLRYQPAMTLQQAVQAIEVGIRIAQRQAALGTRLIALGEMGIGNTTTSAAVLSVLLQRSVEEVTGRGAGLSSEGLRRKILVIEEALALHRPDPKRPLEVLCTVGGLDIAGLVGLCLGAAECGVPVLLDGVISQAAAMLAVGLCPTVREYLFATHCTAEPAGVLALQALQLQPVLYAGMRLGEGTGAVALMPLLDMAMEVYHGATFRDIAIEAYQSLD